MNIDYVNLFIEHNLFTCFKKNQTINISTKLDLMYITNLFNSINFRNILPVNPYLCLTQDWVIYTKFYNSIYHNFLLKNNLGLINITYSTKTGLVSYFNIFIIINKFFKFNCIIFVLYYIFFLTYLENYLRQIILSNNLIKLFILNENEKEIGSLDDFFFFVIIFLLVLFSFVYVSIFSIIYNSSFFLWSITSLFLLSILILTIPLNLLVDFGISYFSYVKGSSISSNLIKELIFDIISVTIIFIRFLIQNIRFLFIFLGIFELLEWSFSTNSLFVTNFYLSKNLFTDFNLNNFNNTNNWNLLIINTLLTIIYYFYYFLHLLFLLIVQIIIYIGISSWLFFFLYSTKFLYKYEKYFVLKK